MQDIFNAVQSGSGLVRSAGGRSNHRNGRILARKGGPIKSHQNNSCWRPPEEWLTIETIEAHTAGEPLRVIVSGLPNIPGETILAKRCWAQTHLDVLRQGLMWEPRGHADMYGAIMTEPVTNDGDLGVLFLHNAGFSTMCGHGVIALAKVALDAGLIRKDGDSPEIRMDTPAGRVTAIGHRCGGAVQQVSFRNVSSFVLHSDATVRVPELGDVRLDVAFGGAFYAFCDAKVAGVPLAPESSNRLIEAGMQIKRAVQATLPITHPFAEDLGFLYGTIFTGPPRDPAHHSRNVCIFAEGEVDRSPTGTGVSARAAIHHARGELDLGETVTIESILGTCMSVRVSEVTMCGPHPAVMPEVTGHAYITGESRFIFDPDDPLKEGFIIR